uniref:WAT1-related protein At2g39510-like n=1 Tax=Tanacetum cinerariifolium TaxID=118510 RepID=A0A6L2JRZ3_TANCI|nr:WAT1-related protein At2g39510-like [Tanacetum cinerariifolium]
MNVKTLFKHSSGSSVRRKYGATRLESTCIVAADDCRETLVLEMLVDESLEMIVDESLDMIVDESLDMIVDKSLMVEDKSLMKLVDETLKLDEEHFESVIADVTDTFCIPNKLGKGGFGQVYVGRSVTGGSGRTTTGAVETALNNVQINDIVVITRAETRPVVDHKLFYAGLKYTAYTFAVAMDNIIPAVTFLIAWVCKSEKVNIKKIHSIRKIDGTLVTVGGATTMTLVVGPTSHLPWTKCRCRGLKGYNCCPFVVKEAADMTYSGRGKDTAKPPCFFTEEETECLTKRIQDGRPYVVQHKVAFLHILLLKSKHERWNRTM